MDLKTVKLNSEGVVKLAYFQKKVEYPFKKLPSCDAGVKRRALSMRKKKS